MGLVKLGQMRNAPDWKVGFVQSRLNVIKQHILKIYTCHSR